MTEFRYRVEFAHEDDFADESVHHGRGAIEITTDRPVETQAQKNDIAREIGRQLKKTKIAVMQIIPLTKGEVLIDYSDYADSLSEETLKQLEDGDTSYVPDISSLGDTK